MAAVDVHDGTAMLAYPVRGQLIQVAKMAVDGASGIILKRIRANIVEACERIRYQQILWLRDWLRRSLRDGKIVLVEKEQLLKVSG